MRIFLSGIVVLVCSLPAGADDIESEKLIEQLGDALFSNREQASKVLESMGGVVLPSLERAMSNQDLEVRNRALKIFQAVEKRVQPLRRFEVTNREFREGPLRSVAFSPEGSLALAGYGDIMRLWNIDTGKVSRMYPDCWNSGAKILFSPDGRMALNAYLWDLKTGKELHSFKDGGGSGIAFSPDGRKVLTGSNCLTVWDVDSGKPLLRIEPASGISVAFSADGKKLFSCSQGGEICLWDSETGRQLRCIQVPPPDPPEKNFIPFVACATFIRDGCKALAVPAYGDGKKIHFNVVRLWDLENGKEIRRFEGHTDNVIALACSPDGRFFLSGSDDGTIRLWDVQSGKQKRCFYNVGIPESLDISPDGRHALSIADQRTMLLWKLP